MTGQVAAYELEQVTFAYGGAPVLTVPHLEIPTDQVTALVGANGSGKTTLLHLLGFIEAPQAGRLCFRGCPVQPEHLARYRRRVGLLLQNPYLFHTSVLENVRWALRARGVSGRNARRRALTALEQVGLGGFERRDARRLSGGEAKRVALARVLALQTDVLLLDEPLAHVDQATARRIEELILQLNRQRKITVVLASHDLVWAQALADRVFSMHRGTLVPASLANVFRGRLTPDRTRFETGRISVYLGAADAEGTHLAIDPAAIVLSKAPLSESSMRNTFRGRITTISEQAGNVRIRVEAGERFEVLITRASLDLLDLQLGEQLYLSFKSTAAKVF